MFDDIAVIKNGKTQRFSSWDITGRNHDYWDIQPGESKTIANIQGPGIITHIWLTQRNHYRECLLKITWDDESKPSVIAPLGDFFCLGHGIVNSFQSALFSASTNDNNKFDHGCALNCYVPMPFKKRAVVEIENQSTEIHKQYFYVDYEKAPSLEEDLGYFHSEFRRSYPFNGWAPDLAVNSKEIDSFANKEMLPWEKNYVILSTLGRGHYLGCNLSVTNLKGEWWGEGDDMIWVDGYKWPPDLHGTGSEDYLNQAWGMQDNCFLRNGSSIYEKNTLGYQTSYVFHLENPVRFQKEIKVTIEHGHGNHLANEMASTAYWYNEKPIAAIDPPVVSKRRPILREGKNKPVPRENYGNWIHKTTEQTPGKTIPAEKAKEQKEEIG